jgi:hypothetical protein
VSGENNILVMADVSGSMMGRPMETSIGLATYFAQHNKGDYHGLYMSFTSSPNFINIEGCETLASAISEVEHKGVGYSTNLDAAFTKILNHAVENGISNEDMPKALVVVSDMEIDPCFQSGRYGYSLDFVQTQKAMFARYGYTMPNLVLWNVEARNDTFLSKGDNVILVSGQSASTFRNLCQSLESKTAWEFMMEVLGDEMYDCVVI